MTGIDNRRQTDPYRQGSIDMGYARNLEDRLANLDSWRESDLCEGPKGSYLLSR